MLTSDEVDLVYHTVYRDNLEQLPVRVLAMTAANAGSEVVAPRLVCLSSCLVLTPPDTIDCASLIQQLTLSRLLCAYFMTTTSMS